MKKVIFILLFFVYGALNAQHEHHQQHEVVKPEQPFQVIIFMAVDCPITQKYMSAFKDFAEKYKSQQVSVVGYFPAGLTKKGEKEFRDEYQIPLSIKLVDDKKGVVTAKFGATITPEVVLVDKNQHVIYQGAFDNWFFELGRYRLEITEHYLIDAVEASLNGKVPPIAKTDAIGCFIQSATRPIEHQNH